MNKLFLTLGIFFVSFAQGQQITNIVLVGADGITKNPKKAISFVVVKRYPDNTFERSDYNRASPLTLLRTYKDADMKILSGRYIQYFDNGRIHVHGQYSDNQKSGKWMYYNDTGKVVSILLYQNDSLFVDQTASDTLKTATGSDDHEATFPGGEQAWVKYVVNSLYKIDMSTVTPPGGKVLVAFVVNKEGDVEDIYLSKSAEFSIDEEAMKIIRKSPKWTPAYQNGKAVKAYRIQPIDLKIQ